MKLAALSDVHGNGAALRAVLTDLSGRGGADHLLVLGDVVLLGSDPGDVVECLMVWDAIGFTGNTDRFAYQAVIVYNRNIEVVKKAYFEADTACYLSAGHRRAL